MFRIKDKLFEIKYAYLDAYIDDNQLVFGLQIKATGTDKYPQEDNYNSEGMFFPDDELYFNSEILLKIKPNEIKNWNDIVGKTIEWDNYPENEEEPHALFYVYEHEQISTAKIEFKNRDNKVYVTINALCNIYAGENFSSDLPLQIDTEIDFFGILCGKISKEECLKEIKPFLDLNNLKYFQNKYGVSIMAPLNTNIKTNLLILGEY